MTHEPTGAARFRTEVGRYKERWYCDPLPGCDIAPATNAVWPSATTVKKASGSDWSNTAIKRNAADLAEHPDKYVGMTADDIGREMRAVNKAGLERAGQRGTGVHHIAEEWLGGPAGPVNADAEQFRGPLIAWLEKYQPEPICMEFVCINRTLNGHGFGGTADALLRIDGKTWLVDWKSRGNGHTVYAQEAAQVGGYSMAEYIIRADSDRRERLPHIDGGLIVSICTDGVRTYPIDIDSGATFPALHAWWVARQTERAPIGKAWGTVKDLEGAAGVAASAPVPSPTVEPPTVTASAVTVGLEARHDEILKDNNGHRKHAEPGTVRYLVNKVKTSPAKTLVNQWVQEAAAAGRSIDPRQKPTVRRYEILRAAHHLSLLESVDTGAAATLLDCFDVDGDTIGARLGLLLEDEAVTLSDMAQAGLDDPKISPHQRREP